MNLEEELYQIAPKLDPQSLREEYFQERIFNVGDLVESLTTGVVGNIIFRGSNYVIILDEEGRTFRTWLDNITEKVHWEVGTDVYRIAVQKLTPGQPVVSYAHKDPSTLNSSKKKSKNGTI